MLSFFLSIFYGIIIKTNIYLTFPHLLRISYPFQLLIGPLLYMYTITISGTQNSKKRAQYLHFIPFVITVVLMIPYYRLPGDFKIYLVSNSEEIENTYPAFILSIFILVQLWVYMIKTYFIVRKHQKQLKYSYSNLSKINLNWIKNVVYQISIIFIVILIIILIKKFMFNAWTDKLSYLDTRIVPIMVSISVYIAGYRAINQREILEPAVIIRESSVEENIDEIKEYILSSKIYLDSDLTLPKLAEALGYTRNQLSKIINSESGMNFFDFINFFRVEKVKDDLNNPNKDNFTILAIAYDAGFKSKATFNKVFKSITGITPSQYKKNRTE